MNQHVEPFDLQPDTEYRNLILDEFRYSHAELEGTTFEACSLVKADLRNARFNGAAFRDCNLSGVRLAGANLFGVTFERCKLMGVDFHDGLTLTAAIFTGCNLDYANFRGVELDKMTFHDCTFREADLSMASLRVATFTDCDLTRVDLTETAFFQTDLRGSVLGGWNLRRDILDGIIVTSGQLRELAAEIGVLIVDRSPETPSVVSRMSRPEPSTSGPGWIPSGGTPVSHSRSQTTESTDGESHPSIAFDHVGVVVEDLEATVQFFEKLGFLRQHSFMVDGPWVDRITNLAGARVEGIYVSSPDGTGTLEFLKFHEPPRSPESVVPPAHAHGIRHIAYRVSDIEATVVSVRAAGYDTVGEVVNRKDIELLAYIRGPEGLIVELAQPL